MGDSATRRRVTVSRRPATGTDLPLLRELFADARTELAVLPPDTRWVLVDMRFRAQRREHAAQYPSAEHDIILVGGTEVGQVVVEHSADGVHVIDLSVALGHRHEGIATAVLSALVDEAQAAQQRIWLTVWSGNTAARHACERAGLRAGPVRDDGHVMMERPAAAVG